MTLRLLPWTGPEGKPCYLSAGDGSSYLSHLADHLEALQLASAEDLLAYLDRALSAGTVSEFELRLMVGRLTRSLRDTVRVAESRGIRAGVPRFEERDGVDAGGEHASEEEGGEAVEEDAGGDRDLDGDGAWFVVDAAVPAASGGGQDGDGEGVSP